MDMQNLFFHNQALINQILSSLVFLLTMVLMRHLVNRAIRKMKSLSPETRRRWIVSTRNILVLVFLGGLIFIWLRQLQILATSLVVIAAAVAIAMKELFLCFGGAVLRAGSKCFSIGDRIEIDGMRGEVIDHSVFGTTLLEIGPGPRGNHLTGRSVFIPNSRLLTSGVVNETRLQKYVLHVIPVPMKKENDWRKAEKALLQAAEEITAPFIEEARKEMNGLSERHGLELPTVDPQVHIQLTEPGRMDLRLRAPLEAKKRGRQEQQILRRYLEILENM